MLCVQIILLIVFEVIGYPVALALFLYRNRQQIHEDSPLFARKFGVIYESVRCLSSRLF